MKFCWIILPAFISLSFILEGCGKPAYVDEVKALAAAEHKCSSIDQIVYDNRRRARGPGAWVSLRACGVVRYYKYSCDERWWGDVDCQWKERK